MNNPFKIVLSISVFIYLLNLSIVFYDTNFNFKWLSLTLWIISAAIIPLYILSTYPAKAIFKNFSGQLYKDKQFWIILFLGIVLNLSFLVNYPFVAIYDQIRDGGLNARQIHDGTITNLFGYGRYESHGLIIPIITSFFYNIFGDSVLTFRFPSAILAILGSLITYAFIKKTLDSRTAFFAALIILTNSLYLYYARTEIVVMFSAFLTPIILMTLYYHSKQKSLISWALLGVVCGLASNFHTSVRVVALLAIVIAVVVTLTSAAKTLSAISLRENFKKVSQLFIVLLVLYFIGFGPKLIFTSRETFFQTRSFTLDQTSIFSGQRISDTLSNYKKSFLVYFTQPTQSTHYQDFKPLLTPLLGLLLVIGLLATLVSKNSFLYYLAAYIFILPFTNSAITDAINSDNRLLPMVIISSIIIAYGISYLIQKTSKISNINYNFQVIFQVLIACYLFLNALMFFIDERAIRQYSPIDYLSTHTIYAIKDNPEYQNYNQLCLFTSPNNLAYFDLIHVQEQYQYLVPNKYYRVVPVAHINDNEVYISKSCDLSALKLPNRFERKNLCLAQERFICPKGMTLSITLENGNYPQPSTLPPNATYVTIPPMPAFIP